MATTGENLLTGFSYFIGDQFDSTTTSNGAAGGTSLIDTTLAQFGDGTLGGRYVRLTSGTADNQIRRVDIHSTTTLDVLPAFSAQVASSVTYEIHRFAPEDKWRALDAARLEKADKVYQIVRDDTLTGTGSTNEFLIPTALRQGPFVAQIEHPLDPDASWNLLTATRGDDNTGWTSAAGITTTTAARDSIDDVIPKYNSDVSVLTYSSGSDGTFTQTVANMSDDISAAEVAGRRVEFGIWVYDRTTGAVAEIIDDSGTQATSSAHQGLGWELLTVVDNVRANNASTFNVRLRVPTGTSRTLRTQGRFLAFEALPNRFHRDEVVHVERDDTLQTFWLDFDPPQGYQIRLIGKQPLTEIGVSTPHTTSLEIDDTTAQVLYASAMRILYERAGLNALDDPLLERRRAIADEKEDTLTPLWSYTMRKPRFRSPYG
jgi:hypothetical protein